LLRSNASTFVLTGQSCVSLYVHGSYESHLYLVTHLTKIGQLQILHVVVDGRL